MKMDPGTVKTPAKMRTSLTKPLSGGIPAKPSDPTSKAELVIGIRRPKPRKSSNLEVLASLM